MWWLLLPGDASFFFACNNKESITLARTQSILTNANWVQSWCQKMSRSWQKLNGSSLFWRKCAVLQKRCWWLPKLLDCRVLQIVTLWNEDWVLSTQAGCFIVKVGIRVINAWIINWHIMRTHLQGGHAFLMQFNLMQITVKLWHSPIYPATL